MYASTLKLYHTQAQLLYLYALIHVHTTVHDPLSYLLCHLLAFALFNNSIGNDEKELFSSYASTSYIR